MLDLSGSSGVCVQRDLFPDVLAKTLPWYVSPPQRHSPYRSRSASPGFQGWGVSWPHVSVITHITSGGKTQQQNFLKAALVNCAGVFIYEGDLGDSTGANPIERRFSARFPKAPGRSMPCRASRSLTRGRDAEWACVWTPSPQWEEATGLNMPYRVPGADVQVGGQWSGGL